MANKKQAKNNSSKKTTKKNTTKTATKTTTTKKRVPKKTEKEIEIPKIEEPIIEEKKDAVLNKKKKKVNSNIIIKCAVLIGLEFILLFLGKRLLVNQYDMYKNKKDNQKLINEVLTPIDNPDDDEENDDTQNKGGYTQPYVKPGSVSVDFNKLKSINADTMGWIMFNGYVNNPIVKTYDNEYYLNHSFYRAQNEAGAIFMDYRNKSFADRNVVIYGHATIDKSMFGTLSDVFTSNFWSTPNADIIYIYNSSNQLMKYQIFSYYTIASEEYYITTHFKTDTAFQSFIDTIKARSFSNRNVSVSASDKIITLSTCAGSAGTNMRRVVHAKRIA